jgi:alpha-L-fucosidase 2
MYPGFAISSIYGHNKTVTDAVATSLYSRGDGVADLDTGWAKVWRGACWALLNNTDEAYSELTLAIRNNFAANGFDGYNLGETLFQIDANFGLAANVMSMLIRDLDRASNDTRPQAVILGPAIPAIWGGGSVDGVRLRGGGSVTFSWNAQGVVTSCTTHGTRQGGGGWDVEFFVKGAARIRCQSK